MTPQEQDIIVTWSKGISEEIPITLALTDDDRGEKFSAFCRDLSGLAPKVRVSETKDDDILVPEIQVPKGIVYSAVPLGVELEPFLQAVSLTGQEDLKLPGDVLKDLQRNTVPAFFQIFIAPHCQFCPNTVSRLIPLAAANEFIRFKIIDGVLFPELAQRNDIRSAPTVLLDDHFRWTGSIQVKEIAEIILNQDPAKLSTSSLEGLIKEGNASKVADMMVSKATIFSNFMDLLVHEKWPVRLGAMVVIEEILERDIDLAIQCIEPLWKRFPEVEDQVRGDIVYIIGESGRADEIPRLEEILGGPCSGEVLEAAQDAIHSIKEREQKMP